MRLLLLLRLRLRLRLLLLRLRLRLLLLLLLLLLVLVLLRLRLPIPLRLLLLLLLLLLLRLLLLLLRRLRLRLLPLLPPTEVRAAVGAFVAVAEDTAHQPVALEEMTQKAVATVRRDLQEDSSNPSKHISCQTVALLAMMRYRCSARQ